MEGWRHLRDELHGRLELPSTITETVQFRDAQDMVRLFVRDCCAEGPSDRLQVRYADFKRAFRTYLWREGIKEQYSDNRITKALQARGYKRSQDAHDVWYFGVGVADQSLLGKQED